MASCLLSVQVSYRSPTTSYSAMNRETINTILVHVTFWSAERV